MFWTNVKRVVRAGFVSFWRNSFVSLGSVLVMTITLFVIGSVIFLLATLDSSLDDLRSRVDISVYIVPNAPESDILSLQNSLTALPEVKEVQYVSREERFIDYKKRHENDQSTLDALAELSDNPLGAVLNVTAQEPGQYEAIAQFLKIDNVIGANTRAIVAKVNYEDNKTAISVLSQIIVSAQRLSLTVTVILVFLSLLIIFNTIRLAIYTARDEISVMKLVGASNKYIRGPFVIVGVMYGFIAGTITLSAFYPLTRWLGSATANFFNGVNVFHYYISNFSQIFCIIMGSGIFLGVVSSYLAVRRYLKV